MEFADGLNCLIGGRGAGKTTALEFLRFGLGLMPDPKANSQRYRGIDALVKANLVNGRLKIELRTKTAMGYTAGRSAHESVEVLNEVGTAGLSILATGGTRYRIQTVALDDRPSIELLDGDTFKESTHLSTGRCTTILPTQSERPLLIDQPEDNLDNAFVYDTIVRALQNN